MFFIQKKISFFKYKYIFSISKRFIYFRDHKRHDLLIQDIYYKFNVIDDVRFFQSNIDWFHSNNFMLCITEKKDVNNICIQFHIEEFHKKPPYTLSLEPKYICDYDYYDNIFTIQELNNYHYLIYITSRKKHNLFPVFFSCISFINLYKNEFIYNGRKHYYYVAWLFIGDLITTKILREDDDYPTSAELVDVTDEARIFKCDVPFIIDIIVPPFMNKTNPEYALILKQIKQNVENTITLSRSTLSGYFYEHYYIHDKYVFLFNEQIKLHDIQEDPEREDLYDPY